jgi:PIN domain nuclease of toxin-antitoxin system
MRLLLDTHVFLWYITGASRLPIALRDSIRSPDNEVYLSVVSIWEAIVKAQLGKLPIPEPPQTYLPVRREQHQIASLSLDEASVARLAGLPSLHRDPFDRMLICQAIEHGLTIATLDRNVRLYPVAVTQSTETRRRRREPG